MSRNRSCSEERFKSNSGRNESDVHAEPGIGLESEGVEDDFLNAFATEDEEDTEPEYGDFWFPKNEECD